MEKTEFTLDFIGIGSGKCGSTLIYDNIVKHPEICDKNLKELNYFSDLYTEHPFSWYQSQFNACNKNIKKGEFSVTYLSNDLAAERIKKHFPNTKLLVVVRNPVNRAFSNYLHSIRKGDITTGVPFSEYIKGEENLLPGKYASHLRKYYDLFPKEKVLVIIFEQFTKDIAHGMREIFEFIGVENVGFLPENYNMPNNEAKSYRFIGLENLLVRIYRWLSRKGYTRLVKKIIDSGVGSLIRKINASDKMVPKILDSDKIELMKYYLPYNSELEKLIGKDLSSTWQ